jgi:hypothetical protein
MKTIFGRKSLPAIENQELCVERMMSGSFFFSIRGFLGTGAPFGADLNLVVQLIMGVSLAIGAPLARQKRYRAHGICQTTGAFLEFVDDRTGDVAVVPATSEASAV